MQNAMPAEKNNTYITVLMVDLYILTDGGFVYFNWFCVHEEMFLCNNICPLNNAN